VSPTTSTPEHPVTVLEDDRSGLALRALAEVTDPASVGELVEVAEREDGVRDLVFGCRLPGYIGWRWTVSTAQVAGEAPTVLELELLPGEGALVAPPWVPWAERLAEYRRTHPDEPDAGSEDDELDEDLDDDVDDDLDEDDEDDDVDPDALEIDGVEFEDATDDESDDEDDDVSGAAGDEGEPGAPAAGGEDEAAESQEHVAEPRG
jgi:Protein of unknown function (DUF3027)